MPKHHVFYVPGIGDQRPMLQDKGIAWWRVFVVVPHYWPVGWLGDEPFADKLERLLAEIDRLTAQGDIVSLLGFSAGASAVINAFAARRQQISAVTLVSGWLQPSSATSPRTLVRNPAFKESLDQMLHVLPTLTATDKDKMLTLNPLVDKIVPLRAAILPGVKRWRTLAFGHVGSIVVALTLYAPFLVRHIKKLAK